MPLLLLALLRFRTAKNDGFDWNNNAYDINVIKETTKDFKI